MPGKDREELELLEIMSNPGLFSRANVTHSIKCTSEEDAIRWASILGHFTRVQNGGVKEGSQTGGIMDDAVIVGRNHTLSSSSDQMPEVKEE